MRKLQIVYSLNLLSKDVFLKVLAKESKSEVIDLRELVTDEMETGNSELAIEIRRSYNSGELVKSCTLNKLILKEAQTIQGNIILTNYPKTIEDYISFSEEIRKEKLEIIEYWQLNYTNVNSAAQELLNNLDEVYKSKMEITLESMIRETSARLNHLNKNVEELSIKFNLKVNQININASDTLDKYFKEKIKNA